METIASAGTVILLTDDDEGTRRVYRRILEDNGYDILEAKSGVDCLHLLYTKKVDLLMLDLMMPGVTGWDVMHIKSHDPVLSLIPTIVVTGLEARAARNRRLDGASILLEKPFDASTLLRTIRHLLDNR